MAEFEIDVEGINQLNARLDSLTSDIRKRGGRSALRKAANVIKADVQRNLKALDDPKTTNDISKNVAVRWNGRLFKRQGDLGFRIGILGGARDYSGYGEITTGRSASENPGGDTFYWRFLEFGTSQAPAKPFMRLALENNISKATKTFVDEYNKAIDRAIKRAKK